jgi:riboflavin kinase / FMN adenylyltransferase
MLVEWSQFIKEGLPVKEKIASVTIGVFDGVHRGHKTLIERVVSYNAENVPVVITFRENHKTISNEQLAMSNEQRDIQTFEQRVNTLEKLGIQIIIVVDFTEAFRKMAGIEFLEILFKRCNIGFFAVGSAFRCGYQLDTDAGAIQKFFASRGIPAEIVPEVLEDSLPISSSRIRAAIAAENIRLAETMLGRALDG